MNIGFIILGILIISGAILLRHLWPKSRMTNVALTLIVIGGIGEIMAGLAPGNVNVVIHAIGALLHWLCGYTGIILLGLGTWKTRKHIAIFSLLCGIIAIAGLFLYGNQIDFGMGRGVMQRIVAYPSTIWMITLGIYFLKSVKIRPDYGIDAPRMGITLLILMATALVAAIFLHNSENELGKNISSIIFSLSPTGIIVLILASNVC